MNLPAADRDYSRIVERRLQLEFVHWPGDWESFIAKVTERGNAAELQILRNVPVAFRVGCFERAARVDEYLANGLPRAIEVMEELMEGATKLTPKGAVVPDDSTRLKAAQAFANLAIGDRFKRGGQPSESELGEALNDVQRRKEDLKRKLGHATAIEETRTTRRILLGKDPDADGMEDPV